MIDNLSNLNTAIVKNALKFTQKERQARIEISKFYDCDEGHKKQIYFLKIQLTSLQNIYK